MLKIKTFIRRFLIKTLNLHRPSSLPYITGDSFRLLAQHIFDESCDFDPINVQIADIIFVRTNYLKDFFINIFPKIPNKFILISHNDDSSVTKEFLIYTNHSKIIHWFAANAILKHEKITPIPLGLSSRLGDKDNIVIGSIEKINSHTKYDKIFYNFNLKTNIAIRGEILKKLEELEISETTLNRLSVVEYIDTSSRYKFIASPPGNGPDCHRTWEALYTNSIPIVERSTFSEHFRKINLPIFIIDSWSDLKKLTVNDLYNIFNELTKGSDKSSLFMDYWVELILSYKCDTVDTVSKLKDSLN